MFFLELTNKFLPEINSEDAAFSSECLPLLSQLRMILQRPGIALLLICPLKEIWFLYKIQRKGVEYTK
jgi:hypothetical protein